MKPLAVLVVALIMSTAASAQTTPPAESSTIVTVGEGIVKHAPDRAWVLITAESRAKSPAEAQKLNADAMTSVMAKLKAAGLPSDAIRTASYELAPEIEFVNNKQTIRGYVARNAIEVRVDDLPKLGDVLDIAVGAGATSVGNIRFDLKDRTKAEQEALQRAIADARTQAETAAQAANVKVDRIVRIEVGRDNVMPPPRPMSMQGEMASFRAAPPMSPGELEVRVSVTMTVAIR